MEPLTLYTTSSLWQCNSHDTLHIYAIAIQFAFLQHHCESKVLMREDVVLPPANVIIAQALPWTIDWSSFRIQRPPFVLRMQLLRQSRHYWSEPSYCISYLRVVGIASLRCNCNGSRAKCERVVLGGCMDQNGFWLHLESGKCRLRYV